MTTKRAVDVIVAGAGMAGCRAALTLAQQGVEVLVLDRSRFPRWKPCAGGMTLKCGPYVPDPLKAYFERTMHGAYVTFGPDRVARVATDEVLGWTVHRETFDKAHLDLVASSPGVKVRLGEPVREVREDAGEVMLRTDDARYSCRALIGADGVNGVVSRALPGHEDRSIGFAYEGEASFDATELAEDVLFDFRKFPRGYGWVFPKRDHHSIGGFVYRGGVCGIKQLYEEFCAETPAARSCTGYRARGYRIPHGGNTRKLNGDRIVLAGDAADLVDPLSGEGIYYALRSGHLAGEAVCGLLCDGEPLDAYGERIREEIQSDLRYARILAEFVYRFRKISFYVLFSRRRVARLLTEVLMGRKTYRQLLRGLLGLEGNR